MWKRAQNAFWERLTRNWAPHAVPNRSAAPLVSFTFDDFPRSAAQAGAQVLHDFGVTGTYFVSGSRTGRYVDGLDHFTEDDLTAVAQAGHEIGCHTYSHFRLPAASPAGIESDLAKNAEFIRRVLGPCAITSFAYPYGQASIRTKSLVARVFPNCRGIWFGVNKRRIDFAQLRGVSLARSFDPAQVLSVLDDAQRSNGWVIFFTHDVSDNPSPYGCTPSQLAWVLHEVGRRRIEVLSMGSAADKVRSGSPSAMQTDFQPGPTARHASV